MITAIQIIADLFPFAVVCGPDLRVLEVASGWSRAGFGPRPGELLTDALSILRPVITPSRDAIADHLADIFVLTVRDRPGVTLRGQFLIRSTAEAGERVIFVGGPWITRLSELADLGLGLGDFPPHDARGDLLVLVQTQWTNLEDMRQLTDQLRVTARSLETRNRELTEQTNRSRRLQTLNEKLQAALEQLRRAQDQLVLQEKMASLGTLAAGIAHEIRNPLNFMTNFAALNADLARELRGLVAAAGIAPDLHAGITDLLADLETNSDRITAHGKRADSIVRGMLQHARGRSGETAAVDIGQLLDESVTLAYHGMRAQDASFTVGLEKNYDPDLPLVTCTPQELGRVFLNVVNNACYATEQRRRAVPPDPDYRPTISVSTGPHGPGTVRIRVQDNGIGMSEQVRSRIFEPFFTTKPAGVGTGLGLSISYDIVVNQHGGRLDVTSVEGRGTDVVIVLPVSRAAQADVTEPPGKRE